MFRCSAAETHFTRLLFLFDSRFIQYLPRVLARQRDLWKSEGVQNKIRTIGESELLPHDRIECDVGSKIKDRHVLCEPSVRELNRSAFSFILRKSQQLDSSVRLGFVVGHELKILFLDKGNNRIRVLGSIERHTGRWRLSSRHRGKQ